MNILEKLLILNLEDYLKNNEFHSFNSSNSNSSIELKEIGKEDEVMKKAIRLK